MAWGGHFLVGHNSATYSPMNFILVPKDSSFKALSNGIIEIGYRWYLTFFQNSYNYGSSSAVI